MSNPLDEPYAVMYVSFQTDDRTIWPHIEGVYPNQQTAWGVARRKNALSGKHGCAYTVERCKPGNVGVLYELKLTEVKE